MLMRNNLRLYHTMIAQIGKLLPDERVTRVRNQNKRQGTWVSLGIHRLTTTPVVQLSDRTGERASLRRALGYDAIRFTPVALAANASSRKRGPDQDD